jgi:SecD/SecF fusion protein
MFDAVGFLKRSFFGEGDLNFMGWKQACMGLSLALIVGGLIAVGLRGKDLLNIDFTGGTSVTFQLTEPVEADELRDITRRILVKDEEDKPVQSKLVRVEKEPEDTVYTLVTSIKDEDHLSNLLVEGFSAESTTNLKTYKVEVTKGAGQKTGALPVSRQMRFVSYQEESSTTPPADEQNDAPTANAEVTSDAQTEAPGGDANASTAETGEDAEPGEDAAQAATLETTELLLHFSGSTDDKEGSDLDKGAAITGKTLQEKVYAAAVKLGIDINESAIDVVPDPMPENWRLEEVAGFSDWRVTLPLGDEQADQVMEQLQADMANEPLWLSLSKIGSKVAGEMQQRAIAAILISLIFIVAYIWFRFQKASYGLAAVIALVHDVLITLGILALCHWLYRPLGFLLIEDFKIGLTEIAAFLTIIGYSLNDTIVVFDRIREVRGRSPKLTPEMVNESVNQTLSRTLLTSGTTLLTVLLLYIFGGEGIHAFAFALLIGVLVGTYSSIFIASPVLLWLSRQENSKAKSGAVTSGAA